MQKIIAANSQFARVPVIGGIFFLQKFIFVHYLFELREKKSVIQVIILLKMDLKNNW